MTDIISNRLKSDMRLSMLDAFFFALMVGAGEGYFVAFALELGLDSVYAGMLGTLPLFIGGIVQLLVSVRINKLGGNHRFVHIGSSLQALSFIPLFLCSWFKYGNFPLLLILNSIYWILAFSIGPAWNSLMSGIIPMEERKNFFSKRIRLTYAGMFIGVIFSGLLLEFARRKGHIVDYFGIVFIFCAAVRLTSSYFLKKHSNPPLEKNALEGLSLSKILDLHSNKGIDRIVHFVIFFKLSVFFSAPFFVPFMIKELKMDYISFVVIISSSILGKIIISSNLAKMTNYISLNKMLFFSCLGISFIPVWWLINHNLTYLFFVEIISGMLWGCFEYSFFLIIFNEISRAEQVRYMSAFNLYHTLAIIVGSLIGGFVFTRWTISGSAYTLVFVLSSSARLLSLTIFPRFLKTLPNIRKYLILKPWSIRPNQGTIDRPVILTKD